MHLRYTKKKWNLGHIRIFSFRFIFSFAQFITLSPSFHFLIKNIFAARNGQQYKIL